MRNGSVSFALFGVVWITLQLAAVVVVDATARSNQIPDDWKSQIDALNAVFAEDDTSKIESNGYPGIYLPLIGNGYVAQEKGVRSDTMFVSGVYNGETTSPSHRARIPAPYAVMLENAPTLGVLFDLQHGTYTRRGELPSSAPAPAETATSPAWYELRWYAHRSRALRSVFVMEFTPHVEDDGTGTDTEATVSMQSNSGAPSADIAFQQMTPGSGLPTDGTVLVQCGHTLIAETADGPTQAVCMVYTALPLDSVTVRSSDVTVNHKLQTYTAAFRTSLDVLPASAGSDMLAEVQAAAEADFVKAQAAAADGQLFAEHAAAWDELWRAGIDIDGQRPDLGLAVNASLVAVLSSVRSDWGHEGGLAPGGLTNYYNGHSFWDTETWMYPPLLFLHPDISRSLVRYRFNRMDGARSKAASYSPPYDGTMFPWESASSGVETCPTFAATGLREQHINGDISIAIWQEWLLRGDRDWLAVVGYPVLRGVADFWVSRVTPAPSSSNSNSTVAYSILDVIPPDEYVDHVDNSIYTNYVAALALRYAVRATEVLGKEADCVAKCDTYSAVADGLVMVFDEEHQRHPEYAGYSGDEVKQGDVVLLPYPLGYTSMPASVRRNDLEYYAARTDAHGPAMTWGMFCVGYLDLGEVEEASRYLNMSFADNMQPPLQVWTETPDGNACNFITGAGGFLQTLVQGYPGLRLDLEGTAKAKASSTIAPLSFAPSCIPGVSHLRLRGVSVGSLRLNVEYWCDEEASASAPVDVRISLNHEFRDGSSGDSASSGDGTVLWVTVAEQKLPLRRGPLAEADERAIQEAYRRAPSHPSPRKMILWPAALMGGSAI